MGLKGEDHLASFLQCPTRLGQFQPEQTLEWAHQSKTFAGIASARCTVCGMDLHQPFTCLRHASNRSIEIKGDELTTESIISVTAVATVSENPSMLGSPQPTIPLLVSTRRNSHRGGTLNNSKDATVSGAFAPFYIIKRKWLIIDNFLHDW